MKPIIVTTALLLCTALAAQAQNPPQTMYKDLIRPNGHKRSAAVYEADVNACYAQTGQSRYEFDGAAMKQCMLSRGYQFEWQRGVFSRSVRSAPSSGAWHRCGPNWIAIGPCVSAEPHYGPNNEYEGTY